MGIDPATGQFSGITVTDPITGQTRSYTGREAAQAVQAFAEQMLKLIPVLPPSAQQTMIDFQLRIQQLLAFARAGAYDAETMGAPNVGTHRDGEKNDCWRCDLDSYKWEMASCIWPLPTNG